MEITFKGGNKIRFKFPVQGTDKTIVQRTGECRKQPSLSVNAKDVLYVIPTRAIQMITVTPAPKTFPRPLIRAAEACPMRHR